MDFKRWLLEAEVTLDTTGHLIDDLKCDSELPNVESAAELTSYIKRAGACNEAIRQAPNVWERFESARRASS
jgi:hypothetical protein